MKKYKVKKIFGPTIQGEGGLSGEVSHFVRFAGCNLACKFCDTDFKDGVEMTASEIGKAVRRLGSAGWVTLTGGEPTMQIDPALIREIRRENPEIKIAIETNGMFPLRAKVDHISFSPKTPRRMIKLKACHSLKVLYPYPATPAADFENFPAVERFIQPIEVIGDIPSTLENMNKAAHFVTVMGGKWKISLQIHKILNVE